MSGHSIENYFQLSSFVPMAVFMASLAGSGHCVSMCGGLVAAASKTKWDWIQFQLGRLAGYLFLGSAAGFVGSALLKGTDAAVNPAIEALSWVSAIALSAMFFFAAIKVWKGGSLHLQLVPKKWIGKLYRLAGANASLQGGLTAFLPCGWLHTFVLGAVATQSVIFGAGFLFLFWLGTLPALGLAPWVLSKLIGPLASRAPRVSATLLILAGVLSVGYKLSPQLFASGEAHKHCHMEHNSESEDQSAE